MTEALVRAIARACLGATAGDEMRGDLRAFLESEGVSADDVEAILSAPVRLPVYRSLVQNGLSSVVARLLPRTRARMNAACAGRFDADFAAFVDQVGPRTHYLRDVPGELLAWALPGWRADPAVPPYLVDLAAHELAHFTVATSEATRAGKTASDVALDSRLAFGASTTVCHHRWAVHELSDVEGAVDVPTQRDVHLLAYRDESHRVRWLELTPFAAVLLEQLLSHESLGDSVRRACEEHRTSPEGVAPEVARVLADLGARGVLLGAQEASPLTWAGRPR